MLEALELAHAEIKKIVQKIEELAKNVGRVKREVLRSRSIPRCRARSRHWSHKPIRDAIMIANKTARQERLDHILAEALKD